MNRLNSLLYRLFRFYYDGFRTMSWWGKKVWIIIAIKLFIIFIILKVFFFHDFLDRKAETWRGKSEYVLNQLINYE
jgi:hypothetical protein